ncbi:MAG: helix-hairpin-helix domain-containing protein [Winogradskyella sp.]|nr:helix-hairpin-helix domain-containing protein [Winogradskyella sp.]MBT8377523.1 helix-hairpin-helix domain-containing protein [Bacteroidia bacterium]NNC44594.1 helix-hairpin-helix domain-containing protein [Winogradskyella sp.]NNF84917.1 helix-hairpin-helix domain-containing protein [Winogradskyella sp.]NNL83737.1 helix-hairpin-helix domain-containing protein [Winogradskyella sp.]
MKSHFQFSRKQRNGIFLLVLIIVIVQLIQIVPNIWTEDKSHDSINLTQYQNEIDSLKQIKVSAATTIYPFNPNYITDYKGYTLGMSTTEIDRLLEFRSKGKWINSSSQFKQVTGISDSLFEIISPFFKFPEWVTNNASVNKSVQNSSAGFVEKPYKQKTDLNKASANQLMKISGVGETLSKRIIAYRNKHKDGFVADVELSEVYGLSPEVIERILNEFTVKTPRDVSKFNINVATRDELVQIPYIDYEVAFNIIEQRTLLEGYNSLLELTKVKDFPINKLDIIKLYLFIE